MNLSSFLIIMKREYLQRVRSVAFWISTFVFPLFMGGLVLIPILIGEKQQAEFKVAVVDEGDAIYPLLEQEVAKRKGSIEIFHARTARMEDLKADVLAKKFNGYLVVSSDVLESGKVVYYGKNVANAIALSKLESAVNRAVIASRMRGKGIPPAEAALITRRVDFDTFRVTEKGARRDKGASFLMTFLLFLTLYMVIILYGSFILRSVLEEKTTRVVEVLVTTIKPFPLMMGKLVGVAAVGFTQYLIWLVLGLLIFVMILPGLAMTGDMGVPTVTPGQAAFFILFFILGYFMYAALYAAVGAMYNTEQEAQQMATIIVIPLIVPIMLMQLFMGDPNGTVATVLSLIPLFTPLLMYLRILIETPPVWQILLGIGLSVGTVFLFVWIAGKIYRVGIFMTGTRPSLREVARWMRYS